MTKPFLSGYVAFIGSPNVGKSTLLNQLLGKKVSITSRKPQTTRQRVLGIKNTDTAQVVYVDTPGLHQDMPRAMNRLMNRVARASLHDVDVLVFLVDARGWTEKDDWVLTQLASAGVPVILAINKIDRLESPSALLPYIEAVSQKFSFQAIVPICAKTGDQVDQLEAAIQACLHEGPALFPPEQFTDRSDRFIAAELIREKILRFLGQELPYATTVTIELLENQPTIVKLSAIIWVEKAGQKAIVIGKGGEQLKKIGQAARKALEAHFGKKVFLQTWVKIKSNWRDSEEGLRQMGYFDE